MGCFNLFFMIGLHHRRIIIKKLISKPKSMKDACGCEFQIDYSTTYLVLYHVLHLHYPQHID